MWRVPALLLFLAANAFAQANVAQDRFDRKQYADAANAYEKIPQVQRDASIHNRLGISYHLSNQLKAAETAYRAALRARPEDPVAANNIAALYYSQRKFSDAERQVRRALEKNPDGPILRLNLRSARYARENGKVARDNATELARTNPMLVEKQEGDLLQMQLLMPVKLLEEAGLHEKRADSYFARRMYDDAIIEYKKSVAVDRYNASLLNRLGLVYHQSQKLNEAERYYREALKQNPYFLEVINNIGTVEYARQRYEMALEQYQRALKIRPQSPTVLLNMGACLFDLKRYEEAVKATQQAIQMDPKVLERATGFGTLIQTSRRADPMVSYYYARIYAAQGEKDRAISYLHRALDEGFTEYGRIKGDPVFLPFAMDEAFLKLMDRIAAMSTSAQNK